MKRYALTPLAILAFACVTGAPAQNLKQRELIAKDKTTVAEHLAAANKTCGSNVTLTTDYSTFADVLTSPDNPNQQSPWAFIVNTTDAMDSVCRMSPEGKQAIQSKLKSIQVKHATVESEKFTNGTLYYAVPYSGAGTQTIIKCLQENL